MIRDTSVQAYTAVKNSGLLGKRQKHAYEVLYHHGPLTGNELSKLMGIPGQWKRCSELKKRGLVVEVGERDCTVTGVNCVVWDVTSKLPIKPPIRVSRKEQIELVRQLLRRVYINVQHNTPINTKWLAEEAKSILKVLETGFKENE